MTLRAMLFDLDGTITEPLLDFPAIKREIGLPVDSFILEALETMTPDERRRAMAIVERHEEEAARASRLNDGAADLLGELARRGIATGVITRNSRRSLEIVLAQHHIGFDVAICRDHAAPKPSPEGIELAMRRLNVGTAECVYVGDHAIDVRAAHAARVRAIWVTNGQPVDPPPPAEFVVARPGEIVGLLDRLAAGDE